MMSQGKRVVFVDHSARPGGGQLGIARYLIGGPRPFEVSVIFLQGGPVADLLKDEGVDVHVIGEFSRRSLINRVIDVRRKLRSLSPSCVVANSTRSSLLLALAPRRTARVFYAREEFPRNQGRLPKRLIYTINCLLNASHLIANSRWTASTFPWVVRRFNRVSLAHPVSGLDPEFFNSSVMRRDDDELVILSLSRLAPWKGVHVLLEAARMIDRSQNEPTIRILIAGAPLFGEHDYQHRLVELSKECPFPVQFLGHVEDVEALLDRSDVLVHCAVEPEAFGQVIVQGMAKGLSVIATDRGGPSEIIRDGLTGFLVAPGDSGALKSVIERLRNDSVLRISVGKRAAVAARRYADLRTVKMLDEVILHEILPC